MRRRCAAKGRTSRGGSALIVVLWVISLLSIIIASFAFDAHVEARIVSYYRKRLRAEHLAESGVEIAKMLMAKSQSVSEDDVDDADRWLADAKRMKKGRLTDVTEELDGGRIVLNIVPEPARRNINNLGATVKEKEENLERILEVGGIPEGMWPVLIESFLDWTDEDEEQRFDGAESENHYLTLTPPYRAKNGPLDTVEELLLIRGWTRAILYGGTVEDEGGGEGVAVSGVGDLLTTYGSGKINVNAASVRVLRTLPGVDELIAGAIVEEREGMVDADGRREEQLFDNVQDLLNRLPNMGAGLENYIETDSSVYRVTAVGESGGVRRQIWLIGEYDGGKKSLNVKRWREQD